MDLLWLVHGGRAQAGREQEIGIGGSQTGRLLLDQLVGLLVDRIGQHHHALRRVRERVGPSSPTP